MVDQLAALGGNRVRSIPWSAWPQVHPQTVEHVSTVLNSGRWAISWTNAGSESFNSQFSTAFAAFCETKYCIPTASGTASLTAALEALGIGPGDEVIVPGLTWVACPSVVANLNATPILVDVDPSTLCLDPDAVEAAITGNTKAILVVHLYSAVADLEQLLALAAKHHVPLIEDCAQAHGARWRGRVVGGIGALGAFSMQNGKVLTSGEGGAVVTNDTALARRARQLISDGRLFVPGKRGQMELVECGEIPGNNACLSEIQAAILVGQLTALEAQKQTTCSVRRVSGRGACSSGLDPAEVQRRYDTPNVLSVCRSIRSGSLPGATVKQMAHALSAELSCSIAPIYAPLHRNVLYTPGRRRRWLTHSDRSRELAPERFDLPVAEAAACKCIAIPHATLLGSQQDMDDVVAAFAKVSGNAEQVQLIAA